jgi:hypothetical protein
MARHFFLLGRSHLTALWFSYHHKQEDRSSPHESYVHSHLVRDGLQMTFLQLEDTHYEPLLIDDAFHPAVLAQLTLARAEVFVSVLGGNDHSMIGLVRHPPLFDFVLPEAPELMLQEEVLLVPAEMLREELARRIAPHVRALELLRTTVAGRIIHLESPPPLPEAHIRRHPEPFAEEIAAYGIAPTRLRYKLWRLHSALYQEACSRIGIEFLAAPPAMRDGEGMMLPHACHPDATHGNDIYGSHVLARLLEHAG